MNNANFSAQNSKYPRCVDGRVAIAIVQWNGKNWVVAKREKEASAENGPEFLGASLMFVKALEVLLGTERNKAFDYVERASKRVGLGLQVHVDDDHGKLHFFSMTDKKIIETIENHHSGCGFAKYAWGKDGVEMIKEAKSRKWRIQILIGSHREHGATIDYRPDKTLDNVQANKFDEAAFNLDEDVAKKVFNQLEIITGSKDFSKNASEWMLKTYRDVVIALEGVKKPSEIVNIKE